MTVRVVVNNRLLRAACPDNSWTNAQLKILGVPTPPRAGWKFKIMGKRLTVQQATALFAARHLVTEATLKNRRKAERLRQARYDEYGI